MFKVVYSPVGCGKKRTVSAIPNGKPFKALGIEISEDHKRIKLIPSETYDNNVGLWIKIDNKHVRGDYASMEETRNLDTIDSVIVRELNGESFSYQFGEVRFSDLGDIIKNNITVFLVQIAADQEKNRVTKSFASFVRYTGFFATIGLTFWLPLMLVLEPKSVSIMAISIAAYLLLSVLAHLYINRKK